ncbi:hypothetical protein [Lacticaseibacillus suihuaensis]
MKKGLLICLVGLGCFVGGVVSSQSVSVGASTSAAQKTTLQAASGIKPSITTKSVFHTGSSVFETGFYVGSHWWALIDVVYIGNATYQGIYKLVA